MSDFSKDKKTIHARQTLFILAVCIVNVCWAQCPIDYAGPRGKAVSVRSPSETVASRDALEQGRSLTIGEQFLQGADPFVLQTDGRTQFIFTTNRPKVNVPVYRSTSNGDWTYLGDALPKLPPWARRGFTWAPEVIQIETGQYALWYTARESSTGRQCLGRAVSPEASGPYRDISSQPHYCDALRDATIDPSPYRDQDGKLYLLWKTKESDGKRMKTIIWLSTLDPKGNMAGTATPLLRNDQAWEGKHVEAPTLLQREGLYYLFYSAGASTAKGYQVSYATAEKIQGPYTKSQETILGGNRCMSGAGHQTIVNSHTGEQMIYFHAVHPGRRASQEGNSRFLDSAYLCFKNGRPAVQDNACEK